MDLREKVSGRGKLRFLRSSFERKWKRSEFETRRPREKRKSGRARLTEKGGGGVGSGHVSGVKR